MICVGKSLGKPKHGCPLCSASVPYTQPGELYTLSDLIQLHQVFNCCISKFTKIYMEILMTYEICILFRTSLMEAQI